jgi:hypothetical protein
LIVGRWRGWIRSCGAVIASAIMEMRCEPQAWSFPRRIDGSSKGTTCKARLGHDIVFLRRPERRVTKDVFDTSQIDGIRLDHKLAAA